ncbi:uncharacterized protein ASCRUDRAFT_86200 [Ascoidea rubescens DSM 1968]|uniref:GSKIP domain-containing protein n=1 Tax=Ascoidea rubescens DSM 1968 TaxID=1344418 RepID=A0A1D2VHY1_9ASCO|nr:hypothetical protein ASCRUDRAFT_86200 [Ascoidea rubescens DSM 1968]ODV61229.1 hypothetical protein ASCRUDRAFT_86200 [Ascoidea rubescens DSM 1968]
MNELNQMIAEYENFFKEIKLRKNRKEIPMIESNIVFIDSVNSNTKNNFKNNTENKKNDAVEYLNIKTFENNEYNVFFNSSGWYAKQVSPITMYLDRKYETFEALFMNLSKKFAETWHKELSKKLLALPNF